MKFQRNIWNQIKYLTSKEIYNALVKDDNWELVETVGAQQIFRNSSGKTISIHLHPSGKKGYGPSLLKELIKQTGWSEKDMRRLKLIK